MFIDFKLGKKNRQSGAQHVTHNVQAFKIHYVKQQGNKTNMGDFQSVQWTVEDSWKRHLIAKLLLFLGNQGRWIYTGDVKISTESL